MKAPAACLAIFLSMALCGCVPLAIGGAAAGGYYVGQGDRDPADIASDSRITTAVKARLIGDKYVDGLRISVETYEGVVTLRGEVNSSLPRDQAQKLAESVNGVKAVRNEIKIIRVPAN